MKLATFGHEDRKSVGLATGGRAHDLCAARPDFFRMLPTRVQGPSAHTEPPRASTQLDDEVRLPGAERRGAPRDRGSGLHRGHRPARNGRPRAELNRARRGA